MLKTNNKIFKERLNNYIFDNAKDHADGYADIKTIDDAKKFVLIEYENEYLHGYNANRFGYQTFKSWGQGLACGGLFDYFYHMNAVQILGDMLDETEQERNKYTEEQASELLTRLIWNAIQY